MLYTKQHFPDWLVNWMAANAVVLWGAADLHGFDTPTDANGKSYSYALSMVVPMNPGIMASIQSGPNQDYADEYSRVNTRINTLSKSLAAELRDRDIRALPLAASVRSDPISIKGDFPHKTAATRAGLGWIDRHCQLITRPYGPWHRLGTVFLDLEIPCGPPIEKSFCGNCMACVEACPAQALHGRAWHPGLPREAILDVQECDQWKKKNYFQYHQGHNCGICSAVCPYGLKVLKIESAKNLQNHRHHHPWG